VLAKRLIGKIIFCAEGFPCEDQIEELLTVVLFCIFPTCDIFSVLINFNFINYVFWRPF